MPTHFCTHSASQATCCLTLQRLQSAELLLKPIAEVAAEAARCAQVLTSTKDIEMWGDGLQTRSFTFIDDCVEGILRITKSDFKEPLNLGSSEMVTP